jgi:hypothetical protein
MTGPPAMPDKWEVSDICLPVKSLEELSNFRLPPSTHRRSGDLGRRLIFALGRAARTLSGRPHDSGFQIKTWCEGRPYGISAERRASKGRALSDRSSGRAKGRGSVQAWASSTLRALGQAGKWRHLRMLASKCVRVCQGWALHGPLSIGRHGPLGTRRRLGNNAHGQISLRKHLQPLRRGIRSRLQPCLGSAFWSATPALLRG